MRQAVAVYPETAFGVFANPSSPVLNTDVAYVSLYAGQNFTMRKHVNQHIIKTYDGNNEPRYMVANTFAHTGTLITYLWPAQAQLFLSLCANTNGANIDLGSFTVDHQLQMDDASYTKVYQRYLGCKVAKWSLACSETDPMVVLNMDIVAQKTATITSTDFPDPVIADFPTGTPYLHTHLGSPGSLTFATARTDMADFNFSCENILDSPYLVGKNVSRIRYTGRTATWKQKHLYEVATDRTTIYETTVASVYSARFDNGTKHIVIDAQSTNFLTAVDDDLDMSKVSYQSLSGTAFYDTVGGKSFSITVDAGSPIS